jgi:hypothetical protein
MSYKKSLPEKKIVNEDGVELFHCTKCKSYKQRNEMVQQKYSTEGVTRTCKDCYRDLYQPLKTGRTKVSRKNSEEKKEYDKIQKEFRHLNLCGLHDVDREHVKEFFKRMGYTDDEPIWVQFHRKNNFVIQNECKTVDE